MIKGGGSKIDTQIIITNNGFAITEIYLKDLDGNPLPNKTIHISYGANITDKVTDNNGKVSGGYILDFVDSITFDGDDEYNGCEWRNS